MSNENHKAYKKDYILLSIYLFLLFVAIFAIYHANTFPDFTMANDIGAARFPIFFATALAILCLIGIFTSLFKKAESFAISSLPLNSRRTIIAILLNIITIYLISIVGFYISAFLFSCSLMILLGVRSKTKIILSSTGLILLIYIVFQLLLNVPLPIGILFE
ncbi:tripartite tricarboxylate transporter TctB family protein [Spirabiliibacterium falconis]|uniref:tripartite tricarboxylate transporter TctB family protein n=1 Tax=Spirabiliibacterium falconis TaxID=572023 RepID=UPI001AADA3FF|nr:tripartite tricarboxylate transporter TctB family protein [Spirabiliibacterium falconis]MBE2893502.1 tripartite tricarboxylate transporter TctB family protein [Spirabiliibacterium falconis]